MNNQNKTRIRYLYYIEMYTLVQYRRLRIAQVLSHQTETLETLYYNGPRGYIESQNNIYFALFFRSSESARKCINLVSENNYKNFQFIINKISSTDFVNIIPTTKPFRINTSLTSRYYYRNNLGLRNVELTHLKELNLK